ncbi:MAG: DUF4332 domain-containing protein [Oscillospiraceae bacterium]
MSFSVSLGKISIDEYKEFLKSITLIPSRKSLQQNIDAIFSKIQASGISTLSELEKALSSPQKLRTFSVKTGISEDYLTLLKRELGCLEPKPVLLKDFPISDEAAADNLLHSGIKTSKDFYSLVDLLENIGSNAHFSSISGDTAHELFCLCALSRINGIGGAAAKCFFDAGFKTPIDVAEAKADEMLLRITEANAGNRYYKAKLGLKDMQFCIDYAIILSEISD